MDSKRQHEEGDENVQIPAQHSKRRREEEDNSVTSIFGNLRLLLNIKTDIEPHMEKFVRRIVREEVEGKLLSSPTINDDTGTSGAKSFKLVFKSDFPSTIFTQSKIEAEIALYDVRSQKIVTDGRLSSIKVEICALDSELGFNCTDDDEDWTTDVFKAKILSPRENKGKLLKGDHAVISLENGVGKITKIVFTDNSSWIRSGHFRLGAIVQSPSNQANIKEAISNRFMVKDSRGEANQKHYPPSLSDPIWRLEKIFKKGKVHEWLSGLKINTVKDLLHINITNPSLLQEKYGKILQEAIKHAKTCPEVTSNGENYLYQNALNSDEKRTLVEVVKQHAYSNLENPKPFQPISHSLERTWATAQYVALDQGLQQFDLPIAQQGPSVNNLTGQQQTWPNLCQPSTSTTSLIGEAAISDQVGSSQLPDQLVGWPACLDDLQYAQFASSLIPPPTLWDQLEYLCNNPCGDYGAESSKHVHTSSKERAKKVWRKFRTFRNVLKRFAEIAVQRKAKV